MSAAGPALSVQHLRKTFGKTRAVEDLSFTVETGEIFGILGPNGAGKTTTLECIEGLKSPDSGQITVAGLDPQRHGQRLYDSIGVQLQSSGIPEGMSPREALQFFGRVHGIKPKEDILHRLGLSEKLRSPYRSLSIGQKRRLSLALALVHEPELLFLDEPTAGLDVSSRIELHRMIGEYRDSGRTVIMATHDMAEAQQLCDRIAIIISGRLAVLGTPQEVTSAGDRRTRISIRTEKSTLCDSTIPIKKAILEEHRDQYSYYITEDPATSLTELLGILSTGEDSIIDLRVERPTLEQRFMEITEKQEATR